MIGASFGNRGSFRLFSVRGIPISAHVSLPLGLLIVSRLQWAPLTWLGFVIIVLVHEGGHALLLRRYGLPVESILIHGFGGECRTNYSPTSWQSAVVAWGGVLAQFALFVLLATGSTLGIWPAAFRWSSIYDTLTSFNLVIALVNLLPVDPLDGREAWRLPYLTVLRLRLRWLEWRLKREKAAKRSHLRRIH